MKTSQRTPNLLYSPEALARLREGFEKLAIPIANTLGPSRRLVMHAVNSAQVEPLADSSTIARRFIELKKRGENVGAMMLRAMVLQIHEHYGDGAATATILAREMLRAASTLLAAGINPIIVKRGIEHGVATAKQALSEQTLPVEGPEMFTRLATGMLGDPEMGAVLGEMLDMMGDNPSYAIQENSTRGIEREYVPGGNWVAIPGDRLFIPEGKAGLELHHPLIMLVDEELTGIEQIQRGLELAATHPERPPLLIIARELKDAARDAVVMNHLRGTLTIGVALLRSGTLILTEDLEDIATLTGGSVLARERGEAPGNICSLQLGRARKVALTRSTLTILEGHGEPQTIRKRVSDIRGRLARTRELDENWDRLRTRVGRLTGGVAVLKIGASSVEEYEIQKEQVTKAMRALNDVSLGAIPGGGLAYLNCIPTVEAAAAACLDREEAEGIRLVANALSAPFRQIVGNYGGIHPPLALAEVQRPGASSGSSTYGFDALRGDYGDLATRGILDSTRIMLAALDAAMSVATMAITTEIVVSL